MLFELAGGAEERTSREKIFWRVDIFFSTVGLDEEMVRVYIRDQKKEDERYDQLKLDM